MDYLILNKAGVFLDSRSIRGLHLLHFRKASLSGAALYGRADGRKGQITKGKHYDGRTINVGFYLKGRDREDVDLLIDEVMDLFHSLGEIGIIHSRQLGKQWFVHADTDFTPEWIGPASATFEVTLFAPYPYARSLGTSLDPKTFDSNLWHFGQGLLLDGTSYVHRGARFAVYNPSSIDITPFEHPLRISVAGVTTNFGLFNDTTGESIRYTGTTNATDTLVFDRIDHYKNGVNILHQTNHGTISLAHGWNQMRVTGGLPEVRFDTPFYYI